MIFLKARDDTLHVKHQYPNSFRILFLTSLCGFDVSGKYFPMKRVGFVVDHRPTDVLNLYVRLNIIQWFFQYTSAGSFHYSFSYSKNEFKQIMPERLFFHCILIHIDFHTIRRVAKWRTQET